MRPLFQRCTLNSEYMVAKSELFPFGGIVILPFNQQHRLCCIMKRKLSACALLCVFVVHWLRHIHKK